MGDDDARYRVLFADGGRRLDDLGGTLTARGFDVARGPDAAELAGTDTGGYDLVVVPHDETTDPPVDGVAGVRTALSAVDCPVVLYAVGYPGADVAVDAMDAGAADAVFVPPHRGDLLATRFRCVASGDEAFADRERALDDFFEHFPEDVFVKDDAGRFAVGSHETTEPQGYDREQLRGLTDYEMFPPDLADALYEQERRIREDEDPEINVVEHYTEDGEERWVSSTKVPRYDDDGEVTGVVGNARDVTRLRRRERLVARLHEASRDLMHAATRADVAREATALSADLSGLPTGQVVLYDGATLRPTDGRSPDVFERHERWFWRAFETGEAQYVATDADGRATQTDTADPDEIDAVVLPLGDHGALGMRVVEAVDEFTLDLANVLAATVAAALDRAGREQELREREQDLQRQNERLEEFATMVSHDLRNPLQVALGAVDMLDDDPDHVARIESALEHMDRLVDELLTLARRGEIVGERVPVDVAALAEAAWANVDAADAALELDDPGRVVADEDRLRELFENLFWVVLRKADRDAVTVRVGRLGRDGLYIEHVDGSIPTDVHNPLPTQPLDTDDWSEYGRYIVSTIAEAYGWDVTTTHDDHARFEITGVDLR